MKFRQTVPCVVLAGIAAALMTSSPAVAQTFDLQPISAGPPGAVSAQAGPGFVAGRDFATEVIGDPWDFEEATDYNYAYSMDDYTGTPAFQSLPTVANGYFRGIARTSVPKVSLQFEGVVGALNSAYRTGVRYPIDANRYRALAFRVRRSVPMATGELLTALWFTGTVRSGDTSGLQYFGATGYNPFTNRYENQMPVGAQGSANQWQIYKVDLTRGTIQIKSGQPWINTVRGIELYVGRDQSLVGATVDLDWVRLYEPGSATASLSFTGFKTGPAITLTARHTETGDTIQIFPDDGTSETKFANGSFTWDYSFLPPGTWTITATGLTASNQNRTITQTLVIDAPPVLSVVEPDVKGGRDFARAVIGDAWDLSNPEDVSRYGRLQQITNPSYSDNGLTGGTTGGAGTPWGSDSSVMFLDDAGKPVGSEFKIDADTYYRLSFTVEHTDRHDLTGLQLLSDEWGSVVRVIWRPPHAPSYTDMQDLVILDGGPQEFAMDLRELTHTGPSGEPGLEPHSQYLWQGQIGTFRIDLEEANRVRSFKLSNVRLATDDEPNGNGFFVIRWRTPDATYSRGLADAAGSDATVRLYWDTDRVAGNGRTLITQGINAATGAYSWNVAGLVPGAYWIYVEVTDAAGNTQGRYSSGPLRIRTTFAAPTDNDSDGMSDAWESKYGVSSPTDDPDEDGVNNRTEYQNGTNPLLSNTWTLPEGSTGFFTERLALANPDDFDAGVSISYLRDDGSPPVVRDYIVPAKGRLSVEVNSVSGLSSTAVSAVLNTMSAGIIVERTLFWGDLYYGGHTGKGLTAGRTSWYLAEGDANVFDTFILLANGGTQSAVVTATYLLESGQTVIRTYNVGAKQRVTIFANDVVGDNGVGLRGKSFSTTIQSTAPIHVERAMYYTTGGRFWNVGHGSAGVSDPSPSWFVAEGHTGPFFDVYLLLANPTPNPVTATVRYLLPGGRSLTRSYPLARTSRKTLLVDQELLDLDPTLTETDVSAEITATGDIIVERAMYWPYDFTQWYEAHASAGITATGVQWGLAEGEYGGSRAFDTYVLIANPSSQNANVQVTLLRGAGLAPITRTVLVEANGRATVSAGEFVALGLQSGEKFGALVTSTNNVPIVVERALYWNGGGVFWGGGTNETAVKIR
ncbi:MAG: hypothetical protein JNM38_00745 [Acidobacteria bacterium]|nr:hypothetical protein [Acidobacteriota bacterium]